MTTDTTTRIRDDGLRYKNKPAGAQFNPVRDAAGIGTMSCFFCGTHRSASQRAMQKVFGKSHAVCNPPCGKNPKSKKVNPSS